MTDTPPSNRDLLTRARSGDRESLEILVLRNLGWLRQRVRRRFEPSLRRDLDSDDLLHDIVVDLLARGKLGDVQDTEHFRAVLVHVVEADVRDRIRWSRRARRDRAREQPLPRDSSWCGGTPLESVTRPSQNANRHESIAWMRAALAKLRPDEQRLLRMRIWEGASFVEIGAAFDIAEDAARMRFNRALGRLGMAAAELRGGGTPG